MQRDPRFYPEKGATYYSNQWGNNYSNIPVEPSFPSAFPPTASHLIPGHGIEFQSSEVCPKNFIIFDQTDHRSQVMFHPAVAHKFGNPGLNMHQSYMPEHYEVKGVNNVAREAASSSVKEDSDDIDALLSLEGEEEEYDDEEVSTARTYGCYGNSSVDSCSSHGYKSRKNGSSSAQSVDSSKSERKRHKMKKMVKALRKIVPGGDQMDTANVLDEAVKYLKSLKVEVQKLDVGDLND